MTNSRSKKKKGAVAIECAITLPILLLMIFATVEVCNFIFLKQTLSVAAYEGVRVAIVPDSTQENVEVQVENILNARGVEFTRIVTNPASISAAVPGDFIEVTVEAEPADNSLIASLLSTDRVITATVQMMKEF